VPVTLDFVMTDEKEIIPACPPFLDCVSSQACEDLYQTLLAISHFQYDTSLCVMRDIRRVPLKPPGVTPEENKHLALSSDGLQFFHPLTLHPQNCQSTDGLLAVLANLNTTRPFFDGVPNSYSILNVDVSLYNTLSHIVYGLDGMQFTRRNLFLLFGIWHAYLYGHVAIWDRFRAHFLADAYFHLFPKTTLMRKPSLFKSSIFFTWLRVAYPSFRDELIQTLDVLKVQYLETDRKLPRNTENIQAARARYIHCINLYSLFDYALPVLQDYGASIKLNAFELFISSFKKLLLLFMMLQSAGSNMYTRCMVIFLGHIKHWLDNKVIICLCSIMFYFSFQS
jgi:hypothetical protein